MVVSKTCARASLVVCAVAALACSGCGGKSADGSIVQNEDAFDDVFIATSSSSFADAGGAVANQKRAAVREQPAGAATAEMQESERDEEIASGAYERKLIRNGDVSLQVQSLADTRSATEAWVSAFGGYVSHSSESSRSLSLTVRIPAGRFDEAMSRASGMGKLLGKNMSSDDVTEQFYDLRNRIETKRILLERYQNYLRQATKMNDILDVEARINEVTADLEAMQGRMNRLSSEIDFSTIHVRATLPPKQTEQGFVLPDTRSQFLSFAGNIAGFFNVLLFAVLYIVIFGLPLVLIAAGLWWLCFGKLGLVRALFATISKKRE